MSSNAAATTPTIKSHLQKSCTNNNSQSLPRLTATCAGCLNELYSSNDEDYTIALGQEWHTDCFRCSVCDNHLHNWYFEKEGLLFCRDDYYQRFGEACQHCSNYISGPVMVAGDHKFHTECFCCTNCRAFIGYGEAFALLERSKLYCDTCYKKLTNSASPAFESVKPLHSIRLVEIPKDVTPSLRLSVDNINVAQRHHHLSNADNWYGRVYNSASTSTVDGKAGLLTGSSSELCPAVRISELICRVYGRVGKYVFSLITSVIDQCCGAYRIDVNLTNLHVGDRILEVNGTPVSDNSIEQIDKMIRSTEILQLTVEHDPLSVCRSCSNVDIKKVTSEVSLPLATSASSVEVFGRTYESSGSTSTATTAISHNDGGSPTRLTKQDKERIYKRKDEGYISGTKTRQLRKYKNLNQMAASDLLNNTSNSETNSTTSISFRGKERCSSMSKLMGEHHPDQSQEMNDLSRTKSFRVEQQSSRIFRPSDLVVGEMLGKGFFGQVFKVTHRNTKEVMVLKELYRVDETAQENFLKEVAVLKSLNHKNVLKFIGVLYKDKRLHLVTEYVAGGSLKELLHDSGLPLTWTERISFAKDIACGMCYLHSKNIIHRDLNSLNCLVREDKTIIVADFGLARIINTSLSTKCTEPTQTDSSASKTGTWGRSKSRQRRQRYTVVGNPYWMAPEMMKGHIYDEKVDVFSFGIVLCEIIGRVQADPDFLPRTSDFGLNQKVFRETFCNQCPEAFYKITFLCCDLNPDKRPSFEILEVWLDSLKTFISSNQPVPHELLYDIDSYQGGSICSTPVDILTPKSNLSRDNLDEVGTPGKPIFPTADTPKEDALGDAFEDNKQDSNFLLPDGIPKSPHLGKDFSPSGERIHNSMRARRRQRFLQAQNTLSSVENQSTERVLEAVKETLQNDSHKSKTAQHKRNLDRGFILDINRSGILHINNVRDLNNLSDFDSSCDTSLNYHEVNVSMDETPIPRESSKPEEETKNPNSLTTTKEEVGEEFKSPDLGIEKQKENDENVLISQNSQIAANEEQKSLDSLNNIKRNLADKSYKVALEDFRTRLNLCKTKFDAIEEANRKNFNNSQNSMRSLFKINTSEDVFKSPPESLKMFQRLKSTKSADSPDGVKNTYRVNQTPVFGRKLTPQKPTEFYKPHSDSLENLDKISLIDPQKNEKKETSPAKRAKLPKEGTFKSYITSLDITPTTTSPLEESAPTNQTKKTLGGSGRLKVSSNLLSLRRTLNLASPTRNEETKSFSRRTLSPTKSSEAKRVSATKPPDLPTTASRNRSIATQSTKPSNRLTILSPEKVHRLNAKLTDQKKQSLSSSNAKTNNIHTNSNNNNNNSKVNEIRSTETYTTASSSSSPYTKSSPPSTFLSSSSSSTTTTTTTSSTHINRNSEHETTKAQKRQPVSRSQFFTKC
ncbi:LIM domain kinase 1 [Musca vetustissima]|uniref:LIM domain kinase 1 n=1 Tax=Musca vetustissima TaxID=27455 RepID=UPI002AB722A3|nr:LIM domain kinase 1 [Musca vetustissima]